MLVCYHLRIVSDSTAVGQAAVELKYISVFLFFVPVSDSFKTIDNTSGGLPSLR